MDVVSLYDKGIRNACASLGTAFGEDHANLLMRHADNIIICYDGDEPGQKASERACSIFESVGITPKVVSLPVEHDPDTFVKQYGKEAFIEFSQKSPYSMDFKLKRLRKSYPDLNDVNAKSNYLNEACKLISGINDEFKQSYYEIKLATETGVGVTAIKNKIDNGATIDLTKDIDEFEAGIKDPMVDKELAILRFIIKNRRNYNIFKLAKGDGSLFSAERKELYDAVEEAYADDSLIDISKILAYNNTIAKYLAEVNVVESTELDENSLETYMDAVKIQQKKSELGNLKKQLETMKLSGDNAGYSDLLKKYNKIKKEQMELINRR